MQCKIAMNERRNTTNNNSILYAQLKIKMLYNSFWSEGCGLSHVVN